MEKTSMAAREAAAATLSWAGYTTWTPSVAKAADPAVERRRLFVSAPRSPLLWSGPEPKNPPRISLFGVAIDNTSVAAASAGLIAAATSGQRQRCAFVNAHVVNEMATSARYRSTIASADRIFADGSGIAIAARLAGKTLADNVNGTDLLPRLVADALAAGVTIYLLGGKPGVADAARCKLASFGYGAAIAGAAHGYFLAGSRAETAAIDAINASGATIVLVGMGVPLQDDWIARNAQRLAAPVLVGVGGLFDYFAGRVSRAPKLVRAAGCEWIWRLGLEPQRLARRYLLGNAVFLARAAEQAWRLRAPVIPTAAPNRQAS